MLVILFSRCSALFCKTLEHDVRVSFSFSFFFSLSVRFLKVRKTLCREPLSRYFGSSENCGYSAGCCRQIIHSRRFSLSAVSFECSERPRSVPFHFYCHATYVLRPTHVSPLTTQRHASQTDSFTRERIFFLPFLPSSRRVFYKRRCAA